MIGRTIKHYRVDRSLGKGGMGVVYLARDLRLDRSVALKVLPEQLTSDPDRRRRFLQEARAACAVNHPAIAQVYDVDESDDGTFIAMELVDGRTIRALVAAREIDLPGAVEIAIQVGQGLAKAHDAGIVHRDIKADNIMVTPEGHAKILDFGLAKLLETAPGGSRSLPPGFDPSLVETRTQDGMVLGTVGYMSPEQARGRPVDRRSDIFSLGIVLYEMVTGQRPFGGNSPIDTLHAIAFEEIEPVTTLSAHVPASLERVVSRCLRKRPEDRYDDARQLVADLKRVQREIESGVSQAIPLRERIRDGVLWLRDLAPAEWILPVLGTTILVLLLSLAFAKKGDFAPVPSILMAAVLGFLIYRRLRNRRRRLMKRFSAKVRKMPEVRIVALDGSRATVLVDKALASTYVRVNALIDRANGKLYFGEPFSVVVRDDLSPQEVLALLRGPGVLYVRGDVVGAGG